MSNKSSKTSSAFTILELLLAIVIMTVLTVMTVSVLTSMRISNRDGKRVTDIQAIQGALEEYYRDSGQYPSSLSAGQPVTYGSNTYMLKVPSNAQPSNDGGCTASTGYTYTADSNYTSYHINFCLGARSGDVGAGQNIAVPGNIITCVPDCYLSCNSNAEGQNPPNTGSDGCGATCANAIATCPTNYHCINNHCITTD